MVADIRSTRTMAAVAANVRAERARAGLTQAQVAERCRWTTDKQAWIEHDGRATLEQIDRLAAALGVAVERLLDLTDAPER